MAQKIEKISLELHTSLKHCVKRLLKICLQLERISSSHAGKACIVTKVACVMFIIFSIKTAVALPEGDVEIERYMNCFRVGREIMSLHV